MVLFLLLFRSEQRDNAQQLCGWTFDKTNKESFQAFTDHLCSKQVASFVL